MKITEGITLKKTLIILMSLFVVASCAKTPKQYNFGQLGEYYWNNTSLSNLSSSHFETEFAKNKGSCQVEENKLAIPEPDCYLPAKNECSGLTGARLGMCYSSPALKCDYTAVSLAKKARETIFSTCMQKSGWQMEWKPGTGEDITGGVFEYVAADNVNEYFIKQHSSSHIGSKYKAVVRIQSIEKNQKSHQGVYVFDVSNNTLKIDNTEPVLVNKGSAADTLLTIIKQLI
ncbi:hypothetical protein [Colwellia hornerae]|uniref:Uncharacterized protein n=1 Tax=Colwellia hornerae TaxID=89402 RepID=A0A5C6QMY5_9GAMM|nr:hypothetical protein [Colwellia hornerae]TWX53685.1 hypothetical protein ESZ28_09395 [Colwellia hornerae]TWX60335.1 hypothetical protein ESZ26_08170 [Colwellia hornerae]TWX70091.1 hypothetical protein ESZ27_04860 [Colwellia hornerae]